MHTASVAVGIVIGSLKPAERRNKLVSRYIRVYAKSVYLIACQHYFIFLFRIIIYSIMIIMLPCTVTKCVDNY